MLFVDAVKARLPLITVTTRDLMSFKEVVKFVTGKTPVMYQPDVKKEEGALLYYQSDKPLQHPDKVYGQFAKAQATLMVINPVGRIDEAFDAGELFVPIGLTRRTLIEAYGNEPEMVKFVDSLLPTLGGLTLKEVGEVIRLTEAKDGEISPQGVTRTRAQLVPDLQGFSAVNTIMDGPYLPNEELLDYANENKALFLNLDTDPRLVPKGLLADGATGTGKTQGAKWLADHWGVPLYRLDPSILNKFYGESERNLKTIFAKVEQEAPCILFIDEAEKFLGNNQGGESDSMTNRLRGMLLWQMQESRAHVFYMLTTNKRKLLPEELIREGRIDLVLTFHGLLRESGQQFAQTILRSFVEKPGDALRKDTMARVAALYDDKDADRVSHSSITAAVKKAVKAALKQGG